MTDNRGEVVAWIDERGYVASEVDIRFDGRDTTGAKPLVYQSLLLAAREEIARLELEKTTALMEARFAYEAQERAEAELAECRRNSERWKDYAMHQEWCAECAEGVGRCYDGRALRDAAIDACVGGEEG